MNRNQWFVFAIILFFMGLFFITDATIQAKSAAITNEDTLFWQAQTIRSAIYGSFGTICFGLFFICLISGFLEKKK